MTTGRQMKVDFEILVNFEVILRVFIDQGYNIMYTEYTLEVLLDDIGILEWNRYFYIIILRLFLIPF